MLVSVIIPTYNSAKFISSAVNSVLLQTYQAFEILIIDDGSTDNTKQVVEGFEDDRIKYFYRENAGPSAARNLGLKNAKGDFVAFLDADDLWLPQKLEYQLDVFREKPGICLVFSAFSLRFEGSDKTQVKTFRNFEHNRLIENLLLDFSNTVPYPSTTLIKKSVLDDAGYFDTGFFSSEDWDLWLRLATKANFYCLNRVLVSRFKPKTSITGSLNLEDIENVNLQVVNKFFKNNPDKVYLKSGALAAIYYALAVSYFYRNRKDPPFRKIFRCLLTCFKHRPAFFCNLGKTRFLLRLFIDIIPK